MTLIELLVVVIILTTVVAAAIPLMAPTNDQRRLREAARSLNTFITGAQARAVATGRPVGFELKKLSQDTQNNADNGVCLEVFYVEQPVPFAGFDQSTRARVALYQPPNANLYGGIRELVIIQFLTRGNNSTDPLPAGWDVDEFFPPNVVRPLDVIEIGNTRYLLLSDEQDNIVTPVFADPTAPDRYFASNTGRNNANPRLVATTIVAQPLNNTGQMLGVQHDNDGNRFADVGALGVEPYWTSPQSYRILRQPSRTSDEPYQLPEGTAIDLRASGLTLEFSSGDVGGFIHRPETVPQPTDRVDNPESVVIMFSPDGSVSRLRMSNAPVLATQTTIEEGPVSSNLYLLVGRRENIPAPDPAADTTVSNVGIDTLIGLTDEQLAELRAEINWLRPESRWVVIGSQSGRVVTVENAFVDLRGWAAGSSQVAQDYRSTTPLTRRAMQIHQAREFTREMSQLGGR